MPLQCWHALSGGGSRAGTCLPHQSMHGILPRPTPHTHFDCSPQQAALCSRAHGRRCGPESLAYAVPGAPEQLPPLPATRHRCWLMSSLGQRWSSFSLAEFQLCCRHAKQPLPAQAETRSDLGKPARACHVVPPARPGGATLQSATTAHTLAHTGPPPGSTRAQILHDCFHRIAGWCCQGERLT